MTIPAAYSFKHRIVLPCDEIRDGMVIVFGTPGPEGYHAAGLSWSASLAEGARRRSIPEGIAMTPLKALHRNSQSVWLDCIRRDPLKIGRFEAPDRDDGAADHLVHDKDCAVIFVKVPAAGPGVQLIERSATI
jgi:hypothetical protein